MAILKYYKVTAEGKVQRLRRECPTAECGAGVFVRLPASTPANARLTLFARRCRCTRTASTVRLAAPFHHARDPELTSLPSSGGKCGLTYMFESGAAPAA